jgi:hypothetical protein
MERSSASLNQHTMVLIRHTPHTSHMGDIGTEMLSKVLRKHSTMLVRFRSGEVDASATENEVIVRHQSAAVVVLEMVAEIKIRLHLVSQQNFYLRQSSSQQTSNFTELEKSQHPF